MLLGGGVLTWRARGSALWLAELPADERDLAPAPPPSCDRDAAAAAPPIDPPTPSSSARPTMPTMTAITMARWRLNAMRAAAAVALAPSDFTRFRCN